MKYTKSIKNKGTIRYLINKGNFKKEKYIVVYYVKNNCRSNSLGICVSKKNGISVQRNKMKRWIREIYKQEESKLKKGITLVVMYKKSVKMPDIDYYKVKENVIDAFEGLDIYE